MIRSKKHILIFIAMIIVLLPVAGYSLDIFFGDDPGTPTDSVQDPSTTPVDPDATLEPSAEPTPESTMKPTPEPTWDELVKGSPVYATLTRDQKLYSHGSSKSTVLGSIKADTSVLLIGQSTNLSMCKVEHDGKSGYIFYDGLSIPEDPPTNHNRLSRAQLEEYANEVGEFESDTNYFLWTDIDRQLTYIFEGGTKNWQLKYVWDCATGLNKTPTTRGHYKIQERGDWFYTERLESGLKWWTRFNGGYLYHSCAYTREGVLYDDTLGRRASAGCVRLDTEHAKWIYDNIPEGTGVWIH